MPQSYSRAAPAAGGSAARARSSGAALGDRLAWAALSLGAATVLALARSLEPSPSGVGTHTQLGLPPCVFLRTTSLPCPGCGLTTSFAHMARFELTAAFAAQPLGVPLFVACALLLPLSALACARAWSLERTCTQLRLYPLSIAFSLCALLIWCTRLVRMWLA